MSRHLSPPLHNWPSLPSTTCLLLPPPSSLLHPLTCLHRYCIKAKSRPAASDNIDMTDFYDDDYDIDDDEDDEDEEEGEEGEDSEDSGTGKA